ncbi:hypothetical protein BLNAU_13433 [Blattamonas nauphoetae]|uniref:Uncharacterized protein n=1 Tax=Blattamonas nauphoetae TaxID=2049346 RepID=A0ABQ9XIY6_9EUKA|nr:hypothetical protein BLNAU_13433 [Blattamonas nauphoetae]
MPKTHPLTAKDKTAKMMKEVPIEEKADTLNTQTARKKAATEDFVVEMKRYDRIRGIGLKTMATMTDVSAKAAELWGKRFGPRMREISGLHPGSLGVVV